MRVSAVAWATFGSRGLACGFPEFWGDLIGLGEGEQFGGEAGEEDVESALELGSAVVGDQDWGEAA
jgi:hypothetical protein